MLTWATWIVQVFFFTNQEFAPCTHGSWSRSLSLCFCSSKLERGSLSLNVRTICPTTSNTVTVITQGIKRIQHFPQKKIIQSSKGKITYLCFHRVSQISITDSQTQPLPLPEVLVKNIKGSSVFVQVVVKKIKGR